VGSFKIAMGVRLHPAVRDLAQQRAAELGRSFSAYVEQLVWRDLAAAHQADRGEQSENGEDWRTISAQAD
jgi:hypothetical protein